jgi:hypothetical protein
MKLRHIIILFLPFYIFPQKTTISGKVIDRLQTPLVYANILAIPENENEAVTFAITLDDGSYKLGLSKNQTYRLPI